MVVVNVKIENLYKKYIVKGNSVFDKIELNEIKDEEIIIVLNLYTYGFMLFIIVILNLILMILKIKKKIIVLLSMKQSNIYMI